jgi:hypothetical protein
VGLGELVSDSIAGAAQSPNRWYALLIGVPILLWVTRSLLRVLISSHRLIWGEVRATAPKATPAATLRLFVLILGFVAATVVASWVRAQSEGIGLLSTLLATLPFAGLWVLVSLRLPHRDAPFPALLPGAAIFAVGSSSSTSPRRTCSSPTSSPSRARTARSGWRPRSCSGSSSSRA